MKKYFIFLFLCLFTLVGKAQTPSNLGGWLPNGQVSAIAATSTYIYLGGGFTTMVKEGVSGTLNQGTGVETATGAVVAGFPKVNGIIYTSVADGNGGWYIGGSFTQVGGVTRNRIARINADKSVDASWNPNANNIVRTMVLSGTHLFIGGDFTQVGVQQRNKVAKISTSGAGNTDATWDVFVNGSVRTLDISGTDLFVGGTFTSVNNQSRNRLFKVTTTSTGIVDTGWSPNPNNSVVDVVLVSGTNLYVGGDFTTIGGLTRESIAKISTTGTGTADANWSANADERVYSIAVSGASVFVGGDFTTIGGQTRPYIAKLSTSNGAVNTWNPAPNGTVYTIAIAGSDVYMGGDFSTIAGGSINRTHIAKVSGIGTGTVDATWEASSVANNDVRTITFSGTNLYVGGQFTTFGGVPRGYLARIQKSSMELDMTWNPNANNGVSALVLSGSDLFVGGNFSAIGGQTRTNIAKISASGTGAADATWNVGVSGGFNNVMCLAVSGTDLYVGGGFTNINSTTRNYIAKISTTGAGTLDATWNPNANERVFTLALSGTDLFVAGSFSTIGGQTRNRLAKLATTGTGAADATWNPNPNFFVSALAVSGTDVYVGGSFTTIGGANRNRVAKLATTGTGTADANWNPNVPTANEYVNALVVSGTSIYVGGGFTSIGGQTRNMLAKLATTGAGAVDANWSPNPMNTSEGSNFTFALSGTDLCVGGSFMSIGGSPVANFAVFDNRLDQTISFFAIASRTFGDAPFTFGANSSAGLPITYTIANTAIATISGNTVTIVGAGQTSITASQAGNATYKPAVSITQAFAVLKANQTITFSALPTKTVGDAPFNVSATASSNLAVTFASSDANVATISGNTITIVGAGTATITASQAGNTNYNLANATQTLTVNKANQTITFGTLPAKSFGDAPFSVSATASSGLAVTLASSNTAVATVSGSTITIVGVGNANITASQAGNANFNPATNVVQALTVSKANQTITFNALPAKTFGDANFNLTATASSNLAVTYTSSNTAVATVSGSTVTIVGVGSTTITASQAGNANYNVATNVAQTLTVNKANQTITFNALSAKTFGDANFTVSATVNTGLPITFSSSNTAVATVSGNTITIVGAGNTDITATQAGNANYNSATLAQNLVVNKANQTINFNALASRTFGDVPFALTATASSGLPVTFASSNAAIISISGSTATILGAGQINITATQAGNANYNAVSKPQAQAILKANQTITFGALATKTMGDAPFSLTATASSNLPVTYTSSNTAVATISGSTITIVGAGTSSITAIQAGGDNYNQATNVIQTLTVNQGNQTITFGALSAKNFGDAPFSLGATASSGLVVSYISSNPNVATISGSTVTIVGVGNATITAIQGGNSNYNAATNVAQTLTVNKGNQTITFGALPNRVLGSANFNLTATASSGLSVTYTSSNPAVATISGSTVTIVGVGNTNITASQAGNGNYNAATNVTQNFTVTKVQQTITFPAITDKVYGDSPIVLNATASSNLAVTYSLTTNPTTGVATLSGNTITFAGVGSVSITASQAGDGSYDPAPNVVRTFNVLYPTSALPNITITELSVYPNPSKSGVFEVSGLQSVDKQQVSYQIVDASGKAILRGVWAGKDRETLNLQKAVSGNYTLVLQGSKNQTAKKIVKQ